MSLAGQVGYWCTSCGWTDVVPRDNLKAVGRKPADLNGAMCPRCAALTMKVLEPAVAAMCMGLVGSEPKIDARMLSSALGKR